MITFVNGFLCASSCDVSKAKQGVDPHQQTDGVQAVAKNTTKNGVVAADKPAVVFGGSLSAASTTTNAGLSSAVQSSAATGTQPQAPSVNLLV
jgi:hypothetical protein